MSYIDSTLTITLDVDLVSMLEQFTRQTKCSRRTKYVRAKRRVLDQECKHQDLAVDEWCRECRAKHLAYRLCGILEEDRS